jgi:hypothetical protein
MGIMKTGGRGAGDELEPGATGAKGVLLGFDASGLLLSTGVRTTGAVDSGMVGVSTGVSGSAGVVVASSSLDGIGGMGIEVVGGTEIEVVGGTGIEVVGGTGIEVVGGTGIEVVGGTGIEVVGGTGIEVVGGTGIEVVGGTGIEVVGCTSIEVVGGSGTAVVVGSGFPAGASGCSAIMQSSVVHGSMAYGGSSRPNEPPSFLPHPYQYGLSSLANDLTGSF